METISRRLMLATSTSILRLALAVPVYLLLTPFVLDRLGKEQFGVWSFATVIGSLINLSDLGFKNSLVFHIARTTERAGSTRSLVIAGTRMYAMSLAVLLGTIWWFRNSLLGLFAVPVALRADGEFVIAAALVAFALRLLSMPLQACIEAHENASYSNLTMLGWLLANTLLTVVGLAFAPTLYTMGIVSVIGNLLVVIALYARSRRYLSSDGADTAVVERVPYRSLVSYSGFAYAATVCVMLREPLYKTFLAQGAGMSVVADFEVSYRLALQLVSFFASPIAGAFAAIALLADRSHEIEKLVNPLIGAMALGLSLACGFLFYFAQPLITWWLGSNAGSAGHLVPLLFAALAIYYSTELVYKTIEASGKPWFTAVNQCFALLVTALILFASRSEVGARGVVWAALCGAFAFSILNLIALRILVPTVTLMTVNKLLLVLLPTMAVIGLKHWVSISTEAGAAIYGAYALAQIVVAQYSGIIDLRALMHRLVAPQLRSPIS
ncbi:MAG: hypothetical protein R3E77_15085 [Steroidobacteraceae bacterium]